MAYNKIAIPTEFRGQPACLEGVPANANPFHGLEAPAGADDRDKGIAALAGRVIATYPDVLAITAVAPDIASLESMQALGKLCDLMLPRVGTTSPFFVSDADGTFLMRGHPVLSKQLGALQPLGCTMEDVGPGMAAKREMRQRLDLAHLSVISSLVDCPDGALLLETGAGHYLDRLVALNEHAISRRARLVCHDLVPEVARATSAALNDRQVSVPYMVVPYDSQFMGEAFRGAGRPIVVTMQDTLSSMSAEMVAALADNLLLMGANKLIVSQASQIPEQSNLFPVNLRPGNLEFQTQLIQIAEEMLSRMRVHISLGAVPQEMLRLAVAQAGTSFHLMTNALLARLLIDQAQLKLPELRHCYGWSTEASKTLAEKEAEAYLEQKLGGGGLAFFQQGTINYVMIGVSGTRMGFDRRIERGSLLVRDFQGHFEISKDRRKGGLKGTVGIRELSNPWNPFVGRHHLEVSPSEWRVLSAKLSKLHTRDSPPVLNEQQHRMAIFAGGLTAHAMLFENIGAQSAMVAQYLRHESATQTMQRLFVPAAS